MIKKDIYHRKKKYVKKAKQWSDNYPLGAAVACSTVMVHRSYYQPVEWSLQSLRSAMRYAN